MKNYSVQTPESRILCGVCLAEKRTVSNAEKLGEYASEASLYYCKPLVVKMVE
ncbi:hypothetical protein [Chryseobacterium elymi]|uniref:hypothetical protein n=1 Tax=Chryseobacterium elymi TaxID=395936 RepID=UPI0013006212|nr:hypothetical protein [Chryseobacterium elymi]